MKQLYNFLPKMNTMKMYKKKKNYRLHDVMNNLHNLLQPKEKNAKNEIQIKIKNKIGIIGIHISLCAL